MFLPGVGRNARPHDCAVESSPHARVAPQTALHLRRKTTPSLRKRCRCQRALPRGVILHRTLRSFKTCVSVGAMLDAENLNMKRKEILTAAIAGAAAALSGPTLAWGGVPNRGKTITVPGSKRVKVAYAISSGSTLIDFAGRWEVFV